MALSVSLIKSMKSSAQTLNTNGAKKPSSSSSGSSSSSSNKSSTSSATATSSTSSTISNNSSSSTVSYNKDTDYQAVINDAIARGDYATAAEAERQRNAKIDGEGLSNEKTYNYIGYTPSSTVSGLDEKANNAYSNLESLTNQSSIISSSLERQMNKTFNTPASVTQADRYLKEQLEKIQSGKTSYSDQLNEIMNAIMNREKFSYDVDTDPLFQQALASAMNSGKQAMQDTIGQASALTGGYGSTYATTAGNQAYNSFIEDAYNNLPQYYQMAMEAYQMEGDEMYRQFGMVSDLDNKEYDRYLSAYDATYQHRNRLYDEAYTKFRDNKNDAFAKANLQLNEYGQRVNAAYNLYNAASDRADTMYQREYNSWVDAINNAWKQKEFDENVRQYEQSFAEEVRQYEATLAENKRQYDTSLAENQRQYDTSFAENQRQYDTSLAENQRQHDNQMAYNYTALEQADAHHEAEMTYKTQTATQKAEETKKKASKLKDPTENQMKKALEAYNKNGMSGLNKYLNSVSNSYNKDAIAEYVGQYGELPLEQRTYTKTKDTTNWGWGVDNNDMVKDQYGNKFRIDQLPKSIQKSLTKLKKGESYTKK